MLDNAKGMFHPGPGAVVLPVKRLVRTTEPLAPSRLAPHPPINAPAQRRLPARLVGILTGELFASIKTSSSIQPVIQHEDFDEDAFKEGIRLSGSPGGLSHHVFSIRSRLVAGESSYGAHASYLSGLLIGAEINAGLTLYPVNGGITLIGNKSLMRQYDLAFSLFDIATTSVPSDQASVRGLWKLAGVSGQALHPTAKQGA